MWGKELILLELWIHPESFQVGPEKIKLLSSEIKESTGSAASTGCEHSFFALASGGCLCPGRS